MEPAGDFQALGSAQPETPSQADEEGSGLTCFLCLLLSREVHLGAAGVQEEQSEGSKVVPGKPAVRTWGTLVPLAMAMWASLMAEGQGSAMADGSHILDHRIPMGETR